MKILSKHEALWRGENTYVKNIVLICMLHLCNKPLHKWELGKLSPLRVVAM